MAASKRPHYSRQLARGDSAELSRQRLIEVLLLCILVTTMLLLACGGFFWLIRGAIFMIPTPTPTATAAPTVMPTPDVRATQIMQELQTLEAKEAVAIATTVATPTMTPSLTLLPDAQITLVVTLVTPHPPVSPTLTNNTGYIPIVVDDPTPPVVEPTPTSTPKPNNLFIPAVSGDSPLPTPTATPIGSSPISPLPTPVATLSTATPSTATPVPVTPTATNIPPTITPTAPPPTPTQSVLMVASLKGKVGGRDVQLRIGPGTVYTYTRSTDSDRTLFDDSLRADRADVELRGRDATGEWVYVCCIDDEADNIAGWARQALVPPTDNELPEGVDEDEENPDDIRRLPLLQPATVEITVPTPTPIPSDDYPLLRYNQQNQGLVASLPRPPLDDRNWPTDATAGGEMTSPPVVVGNHIIIASADKHLYSFSRLAGNQRWRQFLDEEIALAPAAQDNLIFIAAPSGNVTALRNLGNEAEEIWDQQLDAAPATSFNVISKTLFIGAVNGIVYALDQDEGDILREYRTITTTRQMQLPAFGHQLVYLGNQHLWAYDLAGTTKDNNDVLEVEEAIWVNDVVNTVTAPPVYSWPGVKALAELYVADASGRIYCLDANTGDKIWHNEESGGIVTGLAINSTMLFASGDGFIKAISRLDNEQEWRLEAGTVLGGPVVDENNVVFATLGQSIKFLEAATGQDQGSASPARGITQPIAVAGSWIFVPGTDGNLTAWRGAEE